jgi:cardiolipin synthase
MPTPPPPLSRSAAPTPAEEVGPQAWLVPRPRFSGGNRVELLRGGDALFPAMKAAIDRAHDTVWLATYIFHDDPASLALAEALENAARRGVRVRVVIDGFGSNRTLAMLSARLLAAGVQLAVFRPLKSWWSWLQPGQLRRLHQKLCAVDGSEGFVGGINLIDDRFDMNHGWSEQPRLDYAVRARGEVVRAVEQAVRAIWSRAWFGRDWRREVQALWRSPRRMEQLRLLADRMRMSVRDATAEASAADEPMRAALVVRDNVRQRRTIERNYVDAISAARRRVWIVCPYFYPGGRFLRALRRAAQRGVDVQLVLQGKPDYRIAALAARVVYEDLMRHGARIHEYMPAFLHAKVAIVDDDWATVGSSNIDPLSLLLNLEANLVVRDVAFCAALAGEIEAAIQASKEVRVDDLITRGWRGLLRRGLVAWGANLYLRIGGVRGRY